MIWSWVKWWNEEWVRIAVLVCKYACLEIGQGLGQCWCLGWTQQAVSKGRAESSSPPCWRLQERSQAPPAPPGEGVQVGMAPQGRGPQGRPADQLKEVGQTWACYWRDGINLSGLALGCYCLGRTSRSLFASLPPQGASAQRMEIKVVTVVVICSFCLQHSLLLFLPAIPWSFFAGTPFPSLATLYMGIRKFHCHPSMGPPRDPHWANQMLSSYNLKLRQRDKSRR